MRRYVATAVGAILGLGLVLAERPVQAFITRPLPLSGILNDSQYIFTAKVESLDADKPSVVLSADEDLKEKAPFRRLPVLLKADSEGEKEKHTPQVLKRLAPKLPVLVFILPPPEKTYVGFVYSNGTWMQIKGQKSDDSDTIRWRFTHCEPYLRRTFKDSTADLRQVVVDGLAGKKKPPEPDAKVEPGLGPEVKPEDIPKPEEEQVHLHGGPVFAVVPVVLLGGPLALLALLFPAVFGGLMLLLRRWTIALSVLSLNSTLYTLHTWGAFWVKGYWWGTPVALWTAMTVIALVGLLWAWRRHLAVVHEEAVLSGQATMLALENEPPTPSTATEESAATLTGSDFTGFADVNDPGPEPPSATLPRPGEHVALWALSLLGAGLICWGMLDHAPLLSDPWRKALLVLGVGVWAVTGYTFYLRWLARRGQSGRTVLPAEGVLLAGLVAACTVVGLTTLPQASAGEVSSSSEEATASAARPIGVAWKYEAADRGSINSSPLVVGDRVYVAGAHGSAFAPFGRVHCLNRNTGKLIWSFNDDEEMKQVFSTPCLADGRLYIGEGFHQDKNCKLYCLDAATGQKLWEFMTSSHTESSPCVVNGRVYCGAGDDGLYCVDAVSGKEIWHYPGLHVDCSPTVVGNRVYAGSGVGDLYRETTRFCLDAETGKPVWRVPSDLPVWSAPVVAGKHVFFGMGNGNYLESDDHPAGAMLCVVAATGERVWRCDVPEGVLDRPAVDRRRVYFGARDGHCYCVDRRDGSLRWKQHLGSPVVTAPLLAPSLDGGISSVYAIGSEGRVCCLDPDTGKVEWAYDVARETQTKPELFSSPAVVVNRDADGERRLLYFGAGLKNLVSTAAVLYCFEDHYEDP